MVVNKQNFKYHYQLVRNTKQKHYVYSFEPSVLQNSIDNPIISLYLLKFNYKISFEIQQLLFFPKLVRLRFPSKSPILSEIHGKITNILFRKQGIQFYTQHR